MDRTMAIMGMEHANVSVEHIYEWLFFFPIGMYQQDSLLNGTAI